MGEILIAYEREAELETLDRLLTSRGHRVRRATHGLEALEALRAQAPDVIVADINLPRLDGFALCRRVKQYDSLRGVPFIFYTRRYEDPKYERFAVELGADRFFARSVPTVAVLAAIDELLSSTETKVATTTPLPVLDASSMRRMQENEREQLSQAQQLRDQLAEVSQAQERLAASEARFRRLFNLNPAPMWIVDRDTQGFIAVNEAALSIYGYERPEFLRLKQHDLAAVANGSAAVAKRTDWVAHRRKDGSLLAMSLVEQALEFDGREAVMVCGFDVTARLHAHRHLQDTLEDYRARFESAVDGYWLVHDDGRILDVNDAYCRMSGYDRNALLGMSAKDIEAHATDDTTIRLRLAREGRVERYETRHRRHDRTLLDVEVSAGVVRTADGADTGRTIVLIRDISARQRELNQQLSGGEQLAFLVDLFASTEAFNEPAIVRRVVEQAAEVCTSPLAFLYFVNNERRTLALIAWRERETNFTVSAHAEPRSWSRDAMLLECVRTRGPLLSNDLAPKGQEDGLPRLHRVLVVPLVAHNETIAVLGVANRVTDYAEDDKSKLVRLANGVSSVLEIKRAHAQTLGSLQRADIVIEQLVRTLVEMLERHDPHAAGSSRRVAALALAIAREIDFDTQRHNALRIAALLHDVGSIVVPANVLAKPGELTEQEKNLMRTHPFAGWRLLSEIDFGTPVAEIVHQHHERFDGSGYPRALKGDNMLLEAAILAVADTVEAMCARRSYRDAPGIDAALEEITNGSGQRYDPHVAAACTRLFRQHGFVLPD